MTATDGASYVCEHVRALPYVLSGMLAVILQAHIHKTINRKTLGYFQKQPLSLAATKSVLYAAAVQQQWYNCGRASSSCLCASNRGVCVCSWCTAGIRATLFSRPMQRMKHTSFDVILCTVYEAYGRSKISSSYHTRYVSLERLWSPLSTCYTPGI